MLGLLRSMTVAVLSITTSPVSSASSASSANAADPAPAHLLYQFPFGTHVENIASRSNGHLLLSVMTAPILYSIDPAAQIPCPQVVYEFPNATSMTGLAETNTPDVFAIIAGKWNLKTFAGIQGSFAVWSVDFRSEPPLVAMIAPIPDANALNGLTVIDNSNIILLADSALGAIWALNSKSGKVTKAIQDPGLGPSSTFPLGVNGINAYKNDLHFVNSAQGTYGKVAIRGDGSASGSIQVLATLSASQRWDDFTFDSQGNTYHATHPKTVYRVTSQGEQFIHVNDTDLADPTSSTFGKGSAKEESTLYLSVGASAVHGGQVVRVDEASSTRESDVSTCSRWSIVQQVLGRGERASHRLE